MLRAQRSLTPKTSNKNKKTRNSISFTLLPHSSYFFSPLGWASQLQEERILIVDIVTGRASVGSSHEKSFCFRR
jgi:hypothetical protein